MDCVMFCSPESWPQNRITSEYHIVSIRVSDSTSLRLDENLESFASFQGHACCWPGNHSLRTTALKKTTADAVKSQINTSVLQPRPPLLQPLHALLEGENHHWQRMCVAWLCSSKLWVQAEATGWIWPHATVYWSLQGEWRILQKTHVEGQLNG